MTRAGSQFQGCLGLKSSLGDKAGSRPGLVNVGCGREAGLSYPLILIESLKGLGAPGRLSRLSA